MVFNAVLNPIVNCVEEISLSIVPGRPIVLMPNLESNDAPIYDPSPPITTSASISCFSNCFFAFNLIFSSLNSGYLAE